MKTHRTQISLCKFAMFYSEAKVYCEAMATHTVVGKLVGFKTSNFEQLPPGNQLWILRISRIVQVVIEMRAFRLVDSYVISRYNHPTQAD